jgi:hypothetical protein
MRTVSKRASEDRGPRRAVVRVISAAQRTTTGLRGDTLQGSLTRQQALDDLPQITVWGVLHVCDRLWPLRSNEDRVTDRGEHRDVAARVANRGDLLESDAPTRRVNDVLIATPVRRPS